MLKLLLIAGSVVMGLQVNLALAEPINIVAAQRGNWETSIPELGVAAGIFAKHNVEPNITYTSGTGETLQLIVSGASDLGQSIGILVVSA